MSEVKAKGNFERHVLSPGDDVSSYPTVIQAIAAAEWTVDLIAAYIEHQQSQTELDQEE